MVGRPRPSTVSVREERNEPPGPTEICQSRRTRYSRVSPRHRSSSLLVTDVGPLEFRKRNRVGVGRHANDRAAPAPCSRHRF
jgi:hypothetical protein